MKPGARATPQRADRWRFDPADPSDRWRARFDVPGLVWIAGGALAAASRLGPGFRRRVERRWATTVTRRLRLDIRWTGLANIDPSETYLIAPLHESFADVIPLLQLPLGLRFLVRDELFAQPVLGSYLRAAPHISVPTFPDRRHLRCLYAEVGEAFARQQSVVVFPQGTILGIEAAFRPGVERLSRHFARPVLPVVLAGGHRVWEHPYTPTLRYGQAMTVEVLEPIRPAELRAPAMRELERRMKQVALGSSTPPRRFVPERDGWWDDYTYEIDSDFPVLAEEVWAHRQALAFLNAARDVSGITGEPAIRTANGEDVT